MKPKPDPELIDDENPEWTGQDFERSVPFSGLPPDLQKTLASGPHRVATDPPSVNNVVPVQLRADVVEPFRETGPGWEERINLILGDWLKNHTP
jgi:uncharacterized protein (DUF4415 family)